MITGGSSSAEAIAVQSLCQEMGIIFMAGLTHSNDTTGKDRRRYGFRHFFDAYMSGKALGPILAADYGKDRTAYHLTADYTWGWTQEESMKSATEAQAGRPSPPSARRSALPDFSQYLTPVLNSGADVLILNHYGADMVHSLTQAVQFGLRDKQANGKQLRDRRAALLRADGARAPAPRSRASIGTANWDWKLDNDGDEGLRQIVRHRPTARRRRRPRRPATCRPCSTPTRSRRPAPSIRRTSSRRWRASSSTAWATARPNTAPPTTSASRTCWSCAARRSRPTSSTFSTSSRSCRAPRSSTTRTTRRSIRTARPISARTRRLESRLLPRRTGRLATRAAGRSIRSSADRTNAGRDSSFSC